MTWSTALAFEIGLSQRLEAVKGPLSFRQLGDRTGFVPETVRRYVRTGNCPALFVARVATELGVSADWLLTGRGDGPLPARASPRGSVPRGVGAPAAVELKRRARSPSRNGRAVRRA